MVAGLLVTASLTVFAFFAIPLSYEIHGTAVLLPGASTVPVGGNGFLYLGGLNPALEVLLRSVNSDQTSQQILESAPKSAKYSVDHDVLASGPIMVVTARSTTPKSARAILNSVMNTLPRALFTLQADVSVPDPSQMSVLKLAVDQRAIALTSDRTRTVLGIGVGGVVISFLVTGLIDGLVLSIRRRRERVHATVEAASPAAPFDRAPFVAEKVHPSPASSFAAGTALKKQPELEIDSPSGAKGRPRRGAVKPRSQVAKLAAEIPSPMIEGSMTPLPAPLEPTTPAAKPTGG